jgi:pyrroline-5-carboxylate reductase
MAAVGETVRLDDEAQMDAVTAVSGSGPPMSST